jgi:hypothetical protein
MASMNGDRGECGACALTPTVLVAIEHRALRELTVELLERDNGCWDVRSLAERALLNRALDTSAPDLVVLDAVDFPSCCRDALADYPRRRVIVIGPEPDVAYERAARSAGAGAWLSRDRIAEDLGSGMRAALGCVPAPCPTQEGPRWSLTRPLLAARRSAGEDDVAAGKAEDPDAADKT